MILQKRQVIIVTVAVFCLALAGITYVTNEFRKLGFKEGVASVSREKVVMTPLDTPTVAFIKMRAPLQFYVDEKQAQYGCAKLTLDRGFLADAKGSTVAAVGQR